MKGGDGNPYLSGLLKGVSQLYQGISAITGWPQRDVFTKEIIFVKNGTMQMDLMNFNEKKKVSSQRDWRGRFIQIPVCLFFSKHTLSTSHATDYVPGTGRLTLPSDLGSGEEDFQRSSWVNSSVARGRGWTSYCGGALQP